VQAPVGGGSGCQAGAAAPSAFVVSCRGWVPSARIDQSCPSRAKTICEPSGDQAGSNPVAPSDRWPEPSPSMVQSSSRPVRALTNTIVPPGEKAGAWSSPGVFVSRAMWPVAGWIEKRSKTPSSSVGDSKAIVESSGDQAGLLPAASRVSPDPSAATV
jgi:hypothetical protein